MLETTPKVEKKNEFRRNYRIFLNDGFVCKQLFDNCLRINSDNGKRKEKKSQIWL